MITLLEFLILEKFFAKFDDCKVYKNPSPEEFKTIINNSKLTALRLIQDGKDLYFWDAFYHTHSEMSTNIGIEFDYETACLTLTGEERKQKVTDKIYVMADSGEKNALNHLEVLSKNTIFQKLQKKFTFTYDRKIASQVVWHFS